MMSIAVPKGETNYLGGVAHKLRARAAGGGHAYQRERLAARGEVLLASAQRLGREAWARSQFRYRLRRADGVYVNLDLSGETREAAQAWIGFAHQLDAVRRRRPDLAAFRTVELPPAARRGIVP